MGLDQIKAPEIPPYLGLYFEMKHWNCLLVQGGLLDQPDWTWDLICISASAYEETCAANRELHEMMARD